MPASLQLEFNLDKQEFENDLKQKSNNYTYDSIEIVNVPTSSLAINSIYNNLYKFINFLDNVFGIIFKIDEKINEDFNFIPRSTDFQKKSAFLMVFQSTVEKNCAKIYWKSNGNGNFYSIFADNYISGMLCDFLIQEIKNDKTGKITLNLFFF